MRYLKALAATAFAILAVAAGKPHPNWTATVTATDSGTYVLGNPDADIKVAEYVSYTCPHCATFQKQSDAPMRLAYITPGKVSVEVRHLVRDPVDMTVALLTHCGDPKGFFSRHNAFLRSQEDWLTRMGGMSEAQQQRWQTGPYPARMQAIASDFDFYATMTRRGYTRSDINRCLSDEAMMRKLAAQTQTAMKDGVTGTPSFAINGVLLAATHNWQALDSQIKARF